MFVIGITAFAIVLATALWIKRMRPIDRVTSSEYVIKVLAISEMSGWPTSNGEETVILALSHL